MTAPGTPVAAGAFAISSEPREDQPRPVPHDSAGGAEGHPERADLCSIRQRHPPSERSKYSAGRVTLRRCRHSLRATPSAVDAHAPDVDRSPVDKDGRTAAQPELPPGPLPGRLRRLADHLHRHPLNSQLGGDRPAVHAVVQAYHGGSSSGSRAAIGSTYRDLRPLQLARTYSLFWRWIRFHHGDGQDGADLALLRDPDTQAVSGPHQRRCNPECDIPRNGWRAAVKRCHRTS